jgi:ATPase subunit of ABC transporter with duplicated ATPase domains
MITHDRYFLDNVVGWILELDRGKYFPYEGNYSTYLEKKAKRLEQEDREATGRQKAINDELEWIRAGTKGRQTKSKARIKKFEELVLAGKPHRQQGPDRHSGARASGRQGDRGQEHQKAYGDKLLFENLSFMLPPGGIVGVIGPNGAGKSTLFKLITGQEKPDEGTIDIGRPCAWAMSTRAATTSTPEERLGGNLGRARLHEGQQAGHDACLCRRLQLQGSGPAEERRQAVGR